MTNGDDMRDLTFLTRLSTQSVRMEALERRIVELERENATITDSVAHVTARLKLYQQIKDEWDWFFEHSKDALFVAGLDGHFKRVNHAFAETLGYTREELLAYPITKFVHPDDIEATLAEIRNLGAGKDGSSFVNRYLDKAGNWRWMSWRCPGLLPAMPLIYAIGRDITETKQSEQEIMYRATHDYLTGLSNRSAFDLALTNAIGRTERDPNKQLALLMIDLDGFKNVNDTLGHSAGDHLLRMVASRFKALQRQNEIIGRIGGDEFGWFAEGMAPVNAESFANRLVNAVREPFDLDGTTVTIGASIGISTFPAPAKDLQTLAKQADFAMYASKKSGRNRYTRFTA